MKSAPLRLNLLTHSLTNSFASFTPSVFSVLMLTLLGGCALGPDYQRPTLSIPHEYWEAAGWKAATPQAISHEAWWEVFADPVLNGLVAQVDLHNQNLALAAAQYRQALAVVGASEASWLPTLNGSLGTTRSQGNQTTTSTSASSTPSPIRTTDRLSLSSSWEIDLWGRISRQVEANRASAAARAADLAATRLSLQASVVQNYVQLRVNEAQQAMVSRTLSEYRRSLAITEHRYQAGIAPVSDVAQAEMQVKNTEVQLTELRLQRGQYEQAIALLLGKLPSEFRLAPLEENIASTANMATTALSNLPSLPPLRLSLPSTLLEARPDIAAAEQRVAAANAQIGVTQAAFFPALTLSASSGYQNSQWAQLISLPTRFWSLGPAFALPIFDGGLRTAQKQQAEAVYEQTVATYRQTVLTAFQEVESALLTLRLLDEEKTQQAAALTAAQKFYEVTHNQYLAGTVSYLNVATAQTATLTAERTRLDLYQRQLLASLSLIKAVGGR